MVNGLDRRIDVAPGVVEMPAAKRLLPASAEGAAGANPTFYRPPEVIPVAAFFLIEGKPRVFGLASPDNSLSLPKRVTRERNYTIEVVTVGLFVPNCQGAPRPRSLQN